MSTSEFSLIDAHMVFLIDVTSAGGELFHHDLFISNSETGGQNLCFLYQSALEFALKTPQGVVQIFNTKDDFQNPCVRIVLENWERGSRLVCSIFDVKNYPAAAKMDFARFLSIQDITHQGWAPDHFKEFLGEEDLDEDRSKIELLTVEKDGMRTIYRLKNPSNLTSLTEKLLAIAFENDGSLVFKVNTYPYFEIQYPDKTTTGFWLNLDTSAKDSFIHELKGI